MKMVTNHILENALLNRISSGRFLLRLMTSTVVGFATVTAHAFPQLSPRDASIQTLGDSQLPRKTDPVPPQLIRKVEGRYEIYRVYFDQGPTGGMERKRERICMGVLEFPLWDLRPVGTELPILDTPVSCEITGGGKRVELNVNIFGHVGKLRQPDPVEQGGVIKSGELKVFGATLVVANRTPDEKSETFIIHEWMFNIVMTRTLGESNHLFLVSPQTNMACADSKGNNCVVDGPEYFEAWVEIDDRG
jgi:hypothetical protein